MSAGGQKVRDRERVRVRVPTRRHRSRLRRNASIAGLLLGLVAVGLVLDGTWAGITVERELAASRDRLTEGSTALLEGRIGDAQASFELAVASSDRARAALGHPAMALVGRLPWFTDDVEAVRALADATRDAVSAGERLTAIAHESGWDGTSIPGMGSPGRIDTDVVRELEPDLRAAAQSLDAARSTIDGISTDGLVGVVQGAVLEARAAVDERSALVDRATDVALLLPGFLGDPQPRTYLVVMQNLADPRGSGGHAGSYALLRADQGRLSLTHVGVLTQIPDVHPIRAPAEIERRYATFGSLKHLAAATYPPAFTTSARLLLEMWAETGSTPVDGVVAVDSVWMSKMLSVIGPVTTPAWGEAVTAENVSEILDARTFELPPRRSNRVQGALAGALFRAILTADAGGRALGDAMAGAARERHLQVYTTRPGEEALLRSIGAAGDLTLDPDALMVVWDGGSAARTGYFAVKDLTYEATIDAAGSAQVTTTATVRNTAPTGPPSLLLGTGHGEPVGGYSAFVNVYLPPAATGVHVAGGSVQLIQPELDRRVAMVFVSTLPGGSATVTVRYELPDAARPDGDGWRYDLQVVPQPALRPDAMQVRVTLPPGSSAVAHSPTMMLDGGSLTWSDTPVTPTSLWIWFDR
jgi:uncharacterized protein DUF4012